MNEIIRAALVAAIVAALTALGVSLAVINAYVDGLKLCKLDPTVTDGIEGKSTYTLANVCTRPYKEAD